MMDGVVADRAELSITQPTSSMDYGIETRSALTRRLTKFFQDQVPSVVPITKFQDTYLES